MKAEVSLKPINIESIRLTVPNGDVFTIKQAPGGNGLLIETPSETFAQWGKSSEVLIIQVHNDDSH